MRLYTYLPIHAHTHKYTHVHTNMHTAADYSPRRRRRRRRRAMRKKRLVEGRAFMRVHFVLSGREWETKESAE